MCHIAITVQPAYVLSLKTKAVPHSNLINVQLWQTFPQANNPTPHQLVNVSLSPDEVHNLGRRLIDESYHTT
jgi:hypothetical protein